MNSGLQVGLRFHDSATLPFEDRVANIKEQGFTCTHIALSKVPDIPGGNKECPLTPAILTPGYAAYLRHVFEKNEMDIAVIGCYLNLANPDEEKLSSIRRMYTAHLRFASLLGCGMVGTETGAPNTDYHYDKEACHSKEALDIFIRNLAPVVKDAERFGVILAIEPVYKHIVWNAKRAREVLDRIESPNLQIIFDPVNLLHPDNLDHRDEVIQETIDLLGPDICMLHLKDYVTADDGQGGVKMDSVACGLGEMDYSRVMEFARTRPYLFATLENTKPENARQALGFVKKMA